METKEFLNDLTGSEAIPEPKLGNNSKDDAAFEARTVILRVVNMGSRICRARGISRFVRSRGHRLGRWRVLRSRGHRLGRWRVLRSRGGIDPGFRILFSMSADKLQGFNDGCE